MQFILHRTRAKMLMGVIYLLSIATAVAIHSF